MIFGFGILDFFGILGRVPEKSHLEVNDMTNEINNFFKNILVHFTGTLRSSALTDGFHAFHVHEKNDVTTCSTTGGHFQSTPGEIHGYPDQPLPDR